MRKREALRAVAAFLAAPAALAAACLPARASAAQNLQVDAFSEWCASRVFVVGDEVAMRADLVANKLRLKRLVQQAAAPSGQSPRAN